MTLRQARIFKNKFAIDQPLVDYDIVFAKNQRNSYMHFRGKGIKLIDYAYAIDHDKDPDVEHLSGTWLVDGTPDYYERIKPLIDAYQTISVRLDTRAHADVFAKHFDEMPDPQLIRSVIITYDSSRVDDIDSVTFVPVTRIERPKNDVSFEWYDEDEEENPPLPEDQLCLQDCERDFVTQAHAWTRARAEAQFSVCVEFYKRVDASKIWTMLNDSWYSGYNDNGAAVCLGRHENYDMAKFGHYRVIIATTKSRLESAMAVVQELATENNTTWITIRISQSNLMMAFYDNQMIEVPSLLAPLTWNNVYARVLDVAMVFYTHPTYVILWILQQEPLIALQKQYNVVNCIDKVRLACQALRSDNKRQKLLK